MMEGITKIRDKYIEFIKGYLDPGYQILTFKKNPLSPQEAQFKQMYANVISLYSANIFLTVPSVVYYYHYFKASRASPQDAKRLIWARRRLIIFLPFCFSSMINAFWYEKANRFQARLKEIEQFYLAHKEEDINEISFTYTTIQG